MPVTPKSEPVYANDLDAGDPTDFLLMDVYPATKEQETLVLASPENPFDDNGRSAMKLFRLQNGDLIAGYYPKGDVYFELSESAP